jgi:hypothetical protein
MLHFALFYQTMGFYHTAAILKKTYCLSPLNLALKIFQSRPSGQNNGLKMAARDKSPSISGWHFA